MRLYAIKSDTELCKYNTIALQAYTHSTVKRLSFAIHLALTYFVIRTLCRFAA